LCGAIGASRTEPENIREDSAHPPEAAYYAERFCLSTRYGILCGNSLPNTFCLIIFRQHKNYFLILIDED